MGKLRMSFRIDDAQGSGASENGEELIQLRLCSCPRPKPSAVTKAHVSSFSVESLSRCPIVLDSTGPL